MGQLKNNKMCTGNGNVGGLPILVNIPLTEVVICHWLETYKVRRDILLNQVPKWSLQTSKCQSPANIATKHRKRTNVREGHLFITDINSVTYL